MIEIDINNYSITLKVSDAEKWQIIYSDLKKLELQRRIREINDKIAANTATDDERKKLSELLRMLW